MGQRAADAYIDTEAVRLTAWQAAWRLSEGRPATEEVAVAKFWAAEGGQRVAHAAQHLHGGIGVDLDYPLHRYFLWAKQLELTLGGATAPAPAPRPPAGRRTRLRGTRRRVSSFPRRAPTVLCRVHRPEDGQRDKERR